MSLSIVEILKHEHDEIAALVQRLLSEPGDANQKLQLFDELKAAVNSHARAEERVLYPQLEALKDLNPFADQFDDDHLQIEELINEIEMIAPEEPHWRNVMSSLEQMIEAHVRIEEREVFPQMINYFLPEELELMGEEYSRVESAIEQFEGIKSTFRGFTRGIQRQMNRIFGVRSETRQ